MNNSLRSIVDLRERVIQKNRIAFGLRLGAIERGDDTASPDEVASLEKWNGIFGELEGLLDKDIKDAVKDQPIFEYLERVKGVGVQLAAKMIAMIDIERCDTISALWRYAGYAVIDGEREKPTKGEKLHYNNRLKATIYNVGGSFLKCNSPYRQFYDEAKEYYQTNRTDWTKMHIHLASQRKMVKVFLAHLWLVWRELKGLPLNGGLYVEERMGHTHIVTPHAFGWYDTD
jgi:hypothetical protein